MDKTKPTLQEKLSKRKYHVPNAFLHKAYRLIMSKFVAPKYHPEYEIIDDINKCDGPCFLIWNHLSRLDHAFVMEAAYPRKISIVAGYSEFFRSHLHLVFKLMNIIPKKIFTQDMPGLRAIHSVVRQGGCICFSPEGMSSIYGTNQPIVPGTGRFLQSFGIPIYYLELRGSYLTSTKICNDERYGKITAKLSLLFTPEQLEEMTPEEIDNTINEKFRSDDYEWGRVNGIKWKNKGELAKYNETVCYRCLRCGSEFEMETKGNDIFCKKCGNGATVNDKYEFVPYTPDCVIPVSPSEWVRKERKITIDEIRKDENYSFSEKVKIGYLPPYKYVPKKTTSVICGEGTFTVDHKGVHYKGTKLGEEFSFDMDYNSVFSLIVMTDTTHFGLYVKGEYLEFFPERKNVGKLLLLTEEMHRLHVNTWKNFPWNDDLYAEYNTKEEEKQ